MLSCSMFNPRSCVLKVYNHTEPIPVKIKVNFPLLIGLQIFNCGQITDQE